MPDTQLPMTPIISLIYARSLNHAIGKDGRIPWRLPDDFAHFKRTTMGKPILMGRKTYDDHESALPGRLNVVITKQADYQPCEGVLVAHSLEEAIDLAKREQPEVDEIFVIGGVSFFDQAMPIAQRVYETVVDTIIEDADAILPPFDYKLWQTTELTHHFEDERHAFSFTVFRHDR